MNAKNLAQFPRRPSNEDAPQPAARRSGREVLVAVQAKADSDASAAQFLRSFHVLLRSVRLYHQHHPRLIESLKSAGQALDGALGGSTVLRFGVEHDRILIAKQL